jgi:hypothetical protein
MYNIKSKSRKDVNASVMKDIANGVIGAIQAIPSSVYQTTMALLVASNVPFRYIERNVYGTARKCFDYLYESFVANTREEGQYPYNIRLSDNLNTNMSNTVSYGTAIVATAGVAYCAYRLLNSDAASNVGNKVRTSFVGDLEHERARIKEEGRHLV